MAKSLNLGVSQKDDPAEYMRRYRAARPDLNEAVTKRALARTAAAIRVAQQHPRQFATFLAEERKKRGL